MPRTPARISISIARNRPLSPYQPSISSHLTVPPSPTSPRTPLQPPARLHLRTILPPPPLSPNFLASAPQNPYPWIWKCHICGSSYNIGVTRRCLEDGHTFCSQPNPPLESSSSSSSSSSSDGEFLTPERRSKKRELQALERSKARRRKQRKAKRSCRSEFDYQGWGKYNVWRREVQIIQAKDMALSLSGMLSDQYERNCWMDCDFPSECLNRRLERIREARVARDVSNCQIPTFLPQEFGTLQETAEMQPQVDKMMDGGPPIDIFASPSSPKQGILDTERRGPEGEANIINLSVSTVEQIDLEAGQTGLGVNQEMSTHELEFIHKKQKKSQHKIQQHTSLRLDTEAAEVEPIPTSPLKLQFAAEDLEDVDLSGNSSIQTDIQMQEVLGSRSDYLRCFQRGENEETFGDEMDAMF